MSLPHHYVQGFYKLLSLTNEFEVWFPIVGSCFFSTLFLLRSSQATPKGSHPFTKWLLGFMSANFLYLTSINICDRIYLARDDYSKQRPLADLGYFLIPMDARFQLFTDFFAAASIFVICTSLILARDMKNVTVGLRDITIGKIVSMTCHCSTQLPDSREPGFVNGFPLLGYQGLTDRIMSNHIFEFGTALHIATMYFPKKFPTFLRIVILAMYTLAMVSSRGHYTVDCVLAWWTLAATGRLGMDTKVFKVMRIGENARGKGKTEVPLTTEEKLARAFLGFIFACSCCSVW